MIAAAIAAVLALPLAAASEGLPPVELVAERTSYPITQAEVIVDPARSLELEDVLAREAKGTAGWKPATNLNFGFSSSRYWLKIRVANRRCANAEWALEFGYPMTQDLRVYQFTSGKRVDAHLLGRLQPFSARPVDHWNFSVDLAIPKGGRSDLYVMLQSVGHIDAAMQIYTHDALLAKTERKAVGMGIYCGIMLAMILYNLFLFVSIRDRNYLYYIVYAATLGLLQCTLNGLTYEFLWPDWVAWNNISAPVFAGVGYIFLGLFTKSLLETKRIVPKLDTAVNATIVAAVALLVHAFFFYGVYTNRFTSVLQITVPLVLLPVSLACARLGSPVAVYYSIAFGCFFLGSGILASGFLGWVPRSFVSVNSMYFGSAAETVLLSLALAARIKILKGEKSRSESQAAHVASQLAESQTQLERQLAVSALASQVAHDIRSPLAALASVERQLSGLDESARVLVRSAVSRIRDIANSLIETDREIRAAIEAGTPAPGRSEGFRAPRGTASVELISSHVDPLITEKRLQFKDRIGVEIESVLDAGSYAVFARIEPAEFKRGLSNLVNNAVEAVGEGGHVRVELSAVDGTALVKVRDDGIGIAADLIPRLGRRGESHGKPGGHGLGIHQAKTSVESWGGTLAIESELGRGTTVTMRIPRSPAPGWFVEKLELANGCPVVVLDDDTSIHQVWQARFDAERLSQRGIPVAHCSSPEELRAWTRTEQAAARQAVYLLDYELIGYAETGLTLIEDLGLQGRAILVTSYFEDRRVAAECARLRVRMIPKGLAGFVPIVCDGPSSAASSKDAPWA